MSYFFFVDFLAAFLAAGFFAAFFFAAINAYLLLLLMWTRSVTHGLRRGPSGMRIPKRWWRCEMVRSLASGPLPLWWQPRAASPYKSL